MMRSGFAQGGVIAAVVTVVAAAGVGVAGADQRADTTVYGKDPGGPCFSTAAPPTDCVPSETADVSIDTGETVTWTWNDDDGAQVHNAAADNSVAADPNWANFTSDIAPEGTAEYTFNQPGDYEFVCQAHPEQMHGVLHVTGDPIETPTSTPTSTATATPTTQPGTGGGGTTTPSPQPSIDSVKPTVKRLKLKALRHGARVTFRLSEPATVTIRIKRGKKTVITKRVQAAAGKRMVTVRSRKLRKGRYAIQVLARDAVGNRSVVAKKTLRLKR
jgi:plastocyanin